MRPAKIGFNYQNKRIEIPITEVDPNTLNFPIPRPIPKHVEIAEYSMNISKEEFLQDLKFMLPKSLNGNLEETAYESLLGIIVRHIEQFGRILPNDLDTYIGQNILLFSSVNEAVKGEPFSKSKSEELFVKFHTKIVDKFPEDAQKAFRPFSIPRP